VERLEATVEVVWGIRINRGTVSDLNGKIDATIEE
jgi:hypothetical protein